MVYLLFFKHIPAIQMTEEGQKSHLICSLRGRLKENKTTKFENAALDNLLQTAQINCGGSPQVGLIQGIKITSSKN